LARAKKTIISFQDGPKVAAKVVEPVAEAKDTQQSDSSTSAGGEISNGLPIPKSDSFEKENEILKSKNGQIEEAMKSMEKDMHEKQDTIISLRGQLDEIKSINLEMYRKLQECEEELRDKGRLIDRLQFKTSQIATLLQNLEAAKAFGGQSGSTSSATTPDASSAVSFRNYIPSFEELHKSINAKKRRDDDNDPNK